MKKIIYLGLVGILVVLAAASGAAKILLQEQDVALFGKYGFSDLLLILFGLSQLIGGVLLALPKTRLVGAIAVAATFLISLVLLILEGQMPVIIATCLALITLTYIARSGFTVRR